MQRPQNAAEGQFFDEYTKQGWHLERAGWPDFLCVRGAEVMLVEVKPKPWHPLEPEQRHSMDTLSSQGLACMRYSPGDGLKTYDDLSVKPNRQGEPRKKRKTKWKNCEGCGTPVLGKKRCWACYARRSRDRDPERYRDYQKRLMRRLRAERRGKMDQRVGLVEKARQSLSVLELQPILKEEAE